MEEIIGFQKESYYMGRHIDPNTKDGQSNEQLNPVISVVGAEGAVVARTLVRNNSTAHAVAVLQNHLLNGGL